MSSKSVVNISNRNEVLDTIKEYVHTEMVFKDEAMDKMIAKAESMYNPNMSDSEKKELQSIIDNCYKIQNEYDSMLLLEIKRSKGQVDNYGVPTSFNMDNVVFDNSFKEHCLSLVKSICKDEGEDLSEDEFITINEAVIKSCLPIMLEELRKFMGEQFQRSINRLMNILDDSVLPTTKYNFNTLEECAVHYYNLKKYGYYSSYRKAWRDAVDRGCTYTSDRIKITDFKQLERALERVRELGKEEELKLIS